MIFHFVFILSVLIGVSSGYLVYIKNGPIIGDERTTYGENRSFYAFQGIPYAKPPVGDLRFSSPVPPDNWITPKNATQNGNECFQKTNSGSEDCLYLNVYTPIMNKTEKLPVMVWVHGGFFLHGNADYNIYGPDYLLEKDVIVVSLNYRLGVFGFLSTEDEEALGNWGIKDQMLALQWVQDNIEIFGGDKNSVTLFGQSAGSGAVSYVAQTAQAKGLIHKVILHSGTSLSLWALSRPARDLAFSIGSLLGINASDSKTLIKELRLVNSSTLQEIAQVSNVILSLKDDPRTGLLFAPVIEPESDQSVITWKSHEKLSKGDFYRVPYIIGFDEQEAGSATKHMDLLHIIFLTYDLNPRKMVPIDMNLNTLDPGTEMLVGLEIKARYFGSVPAVVSDQHILKFITDDQFVRPTYEAARIMSRFTPLYLYKYSYVGDYEKAHRGNDTLAFHGDELYWLWKTQKRSQDFVGKDLQTRHKMLTMWTNFAKYGNPTPNIDPILASVIWNQVESENIYYLEIEEELSIGNNWADYSIDFWKSLYDSYGNPPYDTY